MKKLFLVLLMAVSPAFADGFSLSSPTIKNGATLTSEQVFQGFGCTGENRSPALAWKNAPRDAKSFAITVYDPDAPTGSGWWHWMVYNIPSTTTALAENAGTIEGDLLPKGAIQNRIDYGVAAFGGACPPQGDKPHRYIFTVYALKTEKLDTPLDATAALTGYMIKANSLAQASFTALYGRSK